MKPRSILPAVLLVLAPVLGLAQSTISINIAGGNTNSPSAGGGAGEGMVTGNAGLGQLGNWNNAIGSDAAGLTVNNLVNSDGTATAASFTWATNNTWSTSTADGNGTDVDLMSGYIDNFHANGSINVAGLGPEFTGPGYNVLVYYNTDNGGMTAGFTVADNAGNSDTRYGHQVTANANYPLAGGTDGYIITNSTDPANGVSANIVQLSGFSGSDFTMTGLAGTFPGGSNRARPNAIQIVALVAMQDGDGDGLPDDWEIANLPAGAELDNGENPNNNGVPGNPDFGAAGDPDVDTLSNLDEFNLGTDPQDEDSDDDNLGDEVEDNTGTYVSPTQTGSDPNDPDSDGDTLQDGAEVDANPFVTDPNNPDTDGDGLDDASEEAANPFVTDPTKEDTDGDGFSDSVEIGLGSDPTDVNDVPNPGGGTVISVNIAGGNQNAPGAGGAVGEGIVTGNAGIGQLGNWNNAIGTDGTLTNIVDASGVPSGADFTWVTNNTWSTSTADGAGTDVDLMSGYLDNFNANGSITVTGLGAEFTGPGYCVYVYYQNDNDANTGGFTATDNLANTDTRYGHQLTANNNWPLAGGVDGYVISTETDSGTIFSANVVKLSGLRGSEFTLTGNAGTGQPSTRARPNAIQIITEGVAVDSDGDGLPDDWETANNLDPNDNGDVDPVNGADGEPDADTLSNEEEFNRGTDPRDDDSDDDNLGDEVEDNTGTYVSPTQTGSNPVNPDSDGDTLEDGAEVEANPFVTDPNIADTDGDGLDDASEQAANPFVTDPTKEDTDGDGFSDNAEITLGSDPTNGNDFPKLGGGTTISVNIAGGNTNSPHAGGGGGEGIVTGNAGLGQLGNWNNAIGGDAGGITIDNLVDDSGTATDASFTWSTNNTWSTSTADGAGTDVDMMSGYLDNFHANGSIVVSGLGPEFTGSGYTVLVYYNNDNSNSTAGFTVTDNEGNTDTRYGHQIAANANYPLPGGVDGYIISTETDPATGLSANIVQFSGFTGSDFTMTGVAGTFPGGSNRARPNAIQIIGAGEAATLGLAVRNVGGQLEISWDSTAGNLYDLLSDLDLEPEIESWEIWNGNEMIAATPPRNTLTIPYPADGERYFAIRQYPTPPTKVFSEDFESGQGGWTTGTLTVATATEWELGTPDPALFGNPAAPHSGANSFGTDLDANYVEDTDIFLRSPAIDLSTIVSGQLKYWRFIDIETMFDSGSVRILDAADDSEIAVLEDLIEGTTVDWEEVSLDLPAEAIGKSVKIEFRLTTDNFGNQAGFNVDDVCVEGSAP